MFFERQLSDVFYRKKFFCVCMCVCEYVLLINL